jgi:hypothetical protein
MKLVQIVPREKNRLYGAMVKKEADIRRRGLGTFHRAGGKKRDEAKWRHAKHRGWIKLRRGLSEVVTAEMQTTAPDQEWQLLSAFLGWVDRHFGDQLLAVNIQYR